MRLSIASFPTLVMAFVLTEHGSSFTLPTSSRGSTSRSRVTPSLEQLYQHQSKHSKLIMSMSSSPDLGSSNKPYEKKKIAVFGAGGYLSSTIYGFLQRASSIYGTGISNTSSSPRAICATSVGAGSLNTILARSFKLAFAGENFIRLTNLRDVNHIRERVAGYDAVVLGTIYQLAIKPCTAGTYGTTPNSKTLEFFMDDRNMVDATVSDDDMDVHLDLFQNSIEACKLAGIQHLVVMETPATKNSKPFADVLDRAQIPFTYIRASGELENSNMYTFEEGVQADIKVKGFTLADNYASKNGYISGDWSDSFDNEVQSNNEDTSNIPREDLAALAVQSLMSLDWKKSRCIDVTSHGRLVKKDESISEDGKYVTPKLLKSDKDWLIQSEILAEKIRAIE